MEEVLETLKRFVDPLKYYFRLIVRIIENKWLALGIAMLMMMASGTEYLWGSYSPDVKVVMNYDQTQINTVGTAQNLGVYLGIVAGFVQDYCGGRVTSLMAFVLLLIGNLGIYLMTIKAIWSNYLFMASLAFLAGNGAGAAYTAALATTLPKFSQKNNGLITGVLVSMFGLSSAIFGFVYKAFPDVQSFLLFMAIFLPLEAGLGIIFMYPNTTKQDDTEEKALKEVEAKSEEDLTTTLPINEDLIESKPKSFLWDVLLATPVKNQDTHWLKVIIDPNFWMINLLLLGGTAGGLTIINNIGNMVLSIHGTSNQSTNLVIALNICDAAGRVISGLVVDYFPRYVTRAVAFTFVVFTIGLTCIGMSFITNPDYYYCVVVVLGLCFGSMFCMAPSITFEIFGDKYFGINWNLAAFGPAISSICFADLLAGFIYDNHAQSKEGNTTDCYGRECYFSTLLIVGFVGIGLAIISGIPLILRTRNYFAVKKVY